MDVVDTAMFFAASNDNHRPIFVGENGLMKIPRLWQINFITTVFNLDSSKHIFNKIKRYNIVLSFIFRASKDQDSPFVLSDHRRVSKPALKYLLPIFILEEDIPLFVRNIKFSNNA